MSNQKKRKVTDQGNEDLTSDHSSAMGNPRVRSKARRTTTTNAFEQEMMRRKNDEFQDLNRNFAVAVRNFHIPAAPADDKPVSMLDLLNEYIRMALLIERRFGGVPCDVVAMGDDDMFQLGLDPDIKRDDDVMTVSPTLITRLGQTIRMVGAGGLHSLALSTTGVPYSWGVSDEGTLGRMADDDELAQKTPLPIKGFVRIDGVKEDGQIVQISAGASHNLFLSMSGAVYQCGMYKDMDSGKFSDKDGPSGTTEGCNKKPMHVFQMPGKVRSICTNGSVNAALMEDSTVLTWGFGNKGELARSAGMTTPGPNGQYELGKLYCYKSVGEGEAQELVPDLEIVDNHFLKPKPVLWATNPQVKRTAIAVAVGTFHILVSARDPGQYQAKLYTSGLNNYGQLGHGDSGDNTERHALTLVKALKHEHIVQVSGGEHFSLALTADRKRLYSFGRGDYGQLGIGVMGTGEFEANPVLVAFPKAVVITDVEAGPLHAMAISETHEVYTWGFNTQGNTGHTTLDDEDVYRPLNLDLMTYLNSDNKLGGCHVHGVSGGTQHALMLVRRYRPRKS